MKNNLYVFLLPYFITLVLFVSILSFGHFGLKTVDVIREYDHSIGVVTRINLDNKSYFEYKVVNTNLTYVVKNNISITPLFPNDTIIVHYQYKGNFVDFKSVYKKGYKKPLSHKTHYNSKVLTEGAWFLLVVTLLSLFIAVFHLTNKLLLIIGKTTKSNLNYSFENIIEIQKYRIEHLEHKLVFAAQTSTKINNELELFKSTLKESTIKTDNHVIQSKTKDYYENLLKVEINKRHNLDDYYQKREKLHSLEKQDLISRLNDRINLLKPIIIDHSSKEILKYKLALDEEREKRYKLIKTLALTYNEKQFLLYNDYSNDDIDFTTFSYKVV